MQRLTMAAMLSCAVFCAAEGAINDAGWDVRDYPERPVIEVINMNKLSWREYYFDRASGQISRIGYNGCGTDPDRRYVDGNVSFALVSGGSERKASFVSMEAREEFVIVNHPAPNTVFATVKSRYTIKEDGTDILFTYQFRRDNDVCVTCSVMTKSPLPDDAKLTVSFPVNGKYAGIRKEYEHGGTVKGVELTREHGGSLIVRTCSDFDGGMFSRLFDSARMTVAVEKNENPQSPTHDRLLTLGLSLKDPTSRLDGQLEYVSRLVIPLYR